MAVGGFLLSHVRHHVPQRTCTGCRAVEPQRSLVRVAFEGPRLVVDTGRRVAGRGAYVHPRPACISIPGLARTLRRSVTPGDVQRLASEVSRFVDNSGALRSDLLVKNPSGLEDADAVETPSGFHPWGPGRG